MRNFKNTYQYCMFTVALRCWIAWISYAFICYREIWQYTICWQQCSLTKMILVISIDSSFNFFPCGVRWSAERLSWFSRCPSCQNFPVPHGFWGTFRILDPVVSSQLDMHGSPPKGAPSMHLNQMYKTPQLAHFLANEQQLNLWGNSLGLLLTANSFFQLQSKAPDDSKWGFYRRATGELKALLCGSAESSPWQSWNWE